jgi:hypothetical protein
MRRKTFPEYGGKWQVWTGGGFLVWSRDGRDQRSADGRRQPAICFEEMTPGAIMI